jgi:hypothetical protein
MLILDHLRTGLLASLCLLGLACGGTDKPRADASADRAGIDSARIDSARSDLKPSSEARRDIGTPPHLTSTHSGWSKPLCLSTGCHAGAKAPHAGKSYRPPDCTDCHGFNGAKHKEHATKSQPTCSNCHTAGNHQVPHDPSFKVPDDCITCHFHPGNPDGT